jgi:deoxycytidylate deaminase
MDGVMKDGAIKTGEQLEKCICKHAEDSAILQNSKECQGLTPYHRRTLIYCKVFYNYFSKFT